jgi:hypothetical protein
MPDPVLERFHRALVDEIEAQRPEYLSAPFTVAEIYQNLVPYGSHRDRIGVEINGDYEIALLRLLVGEGGYLQLESEAALREIRSELGSSNPNTALYREFAAADVRLNPAHLDRSSRTVQEGSKSASALGSRDAAATAQPAAAGVPDSPSPLGAERMDDTPIDVSLAVPEAPASPESGTRRAEVPTEACPWCAERLPQRPGVSFCPFCGADLSLMPCGACGSVMEPGWKFCASCGTEAGA